MKTPGIIIININAAFAPISINAEHLLTTIIGTSYISYHFFESPLLLHVSCKPVIQENIFIRILAKAHILWFDIEMNQMQTVIQEQRFFYLLEIIFANIVKILIALFHGKLNARI